MGLLDSLMIDTINVLHTQYTNKDNKQKIDEMTCGIFGLFMNKIKPYFLLITILLLLIIVLNIVQFYYFMRAFLTKIDVKDQANMVKEVMVL